jgi:hypothetical protein
LSQDITVYVSCLVEGKTTYDHPRGPLLGTRSYNLRLPRVAMQSGYMRLSYYRSGMLKSIFNYGKVSYIRSVKVTRLFLKLMSTVRHKTTLCLSIKHLSESFKTTNLESYFRTVQVSEGNRRTLRGPLGTRSYILGHLGNRSLFTRSSYRHLPSYIIRRRP